MSDRIMPALPSNEITASELIPFRSRKISFLHSKALLPIAIVVTTCLSLYTANIQVYAGAMQYMLSLALLILSLTFLGVYYYGGELKNPLWYLWPAILSYCQVRYCLSYYDAFFQQTLPGNTRVNFDSFSSQFVAYFFGVGLREDFLKAVPSLIGFAVALALRSGKVPSNGLTRGIALQGPLDGLLVGVAAGCGFTFIETMEQYVPRTMHAVWDQTNHDYGLAVLFGLKLMVPRIMDGVMGHAAYGGIVGYFVGLAANHPRAAWKVIPFGLVISAVVHTLWDTLGTALDPEKYTWTLDVPGLGPVTIQAYLWVAGLLTAFFFFGCLLKAKQLEASRIGGSIDGRSVLALSPPPGYAPAGQVPPPVPGVAGAFTGAVTAAEALIGVEARTTVPPPGSPRPDPTLPAHGYWIGTTTARYAMAANAPIDFAALFGAPAGQAGTILPTPEGGMELVNTGAGTWPVATSDGPTYEVAPGSRLRVAGGLTLRFGTSPIAIEAY